MRVLPIKLSNLQLHISNHKSFFIVGIGIVGALVVKSDIALPKINEPETDDLKGKLKFLYIVERSKSVVSCLALRSSNCIVEVVKLAHRLVFFFC